MYNLVNQLLLLPILPTLVLASVRAYVSVHKTDIANAASGQQEVHFTRPVTMLRQQDLTCKEELRVIWDVQFSYTAYINRFAAKIHFLPHILPLQSFSHLLVRTSLAHILHEETL